MLIRLTGIFILLTFFLVRSTPLFAIESSATLKVLSCCAEQPLEETPDADSDGEQLEIIDEDFINEPLRSPEYFTFVNKATLLNAPYISTPYISLPYPPPNGR